MYAILWQRNTLFGDEYVHGVHLAFCYSLSHNTKVEPFQEVVILPPFPFGKTPLHQHKPSIINYRKLAICSEFGGKVPISHALSCCHLLNVPLSRFSETLSSTRSHAPTLW